MEQDDLIREFLEESKTHLDSLEKNLLLIESDPLNKEVLNALFRSVHTIKGASGFFDFSTILKLCHEMESLFAKARSDKLVIGSKILDVLLEGLDHLKAMFQDVYKSNEYNDWLKWPEKLEDALQGGTVIQGGADGQSGTDRGKNLNCPEVQSVFQFNVSKVQFKSYTLSGKNIYVVWLTFSDSFSNSKYSDAISFLQEMSEISEVIESVFMEKGWENFDQTNEIESRNVECVLIVCTLLEKSILSAALNISETCVCGISEELYSSTQIVISKNERGEVCATGSALQQNEKREAATDKKDDPAKKNTVVVAEESLRVPINRLDRILNLTGELVLARNRIGQIISQENLQKDTGMEAVFQTINRITYALQSEVMNTRMQQLWVLFSRFPRIVRDLARSLSKEIDVVFEGADVEVDKTVIEALSDPLIHMVRNTVDHGIEMPDERRRQGKAVKGVLKIKAYCEAGQVLIEVKDDGRGMDCQKVALKAFEKGIISEDELNHLSLQEKIMLIFKPGFSTAEQVSSISGRGVGMDVVKANIEKIGGLVEVETAVGEGTLIRIRLPLTLAIMPGLILVCEDQKYVIPQINIHEVMLLSQDMWKSKIVRWSDREVLWYRGHPVVLITLAECLEIRRQFAHPEIGNVLADRRNYFSDRRKHTHHENHASPQLNRRCQTDRRVREQEPLKIIVVKSGNTKIALVVDEISDPEEVVVKHLPSFIDHIAQLNGTAYLGDGSLSLILDVQGIIDYLKLDQYKTEDEVLETAEFEEQSFLWFDTGASETYLIPLPLLVRVQPIVKTDLQLIGDRECYEYHGEIYRVLKVEDFLTVSPSHIKNEQAYLIFPLFTGSVKIAILANQILDTQVIAQEFNENALALPGVIGSTLINHKIALILDVHHMSETLQPEKTVTVNKKARILVAEDTPFYQAILKAYLGPAGYTFDMVSNGALALEKIMYSPKYDLIVTDIEMPVLDGFELCAKIREVVAYSSTPVIAFTGLDKEEYVSKAKEVKLSAWVAKLEKQALLQVVESFLNGCKDLNRIYTI